MQAILPCPPILKVLTNNQRRFMAVHLHSSAIFILMNTDLNNIGDCNIVMSRAHAV